MLAATGATEVRVYSRDADRRTAFSRSMAEEFPTVSFDAAPSAAAACDGATNIVTITNSPTPVLGPDDVPAGGPHRWRPATTPG